jgi:AraC family transcriptional regulator of adaptative response/methylated-DNA-[protein]-cysteine methyltransferase
LYHQLKKETMQQLTDYDRIAKAIDYIKDHFKTQPSLETIAANVGLSPFHFQRLFTRWAGVSPKKFLQYISLDYAKKLLKEDQATLFDTAYEAGLSGASRLHDLFVTIEGMTPGEYKNGGEQLTIHYQFAESPFGPLIIASTPKGICHIAFADEEKEAVSTLQHIFPNASYRQQTDVLQQQALQIFNDDWNELSNIQLHLKGTAFQLKVWETLLKIPSGKLASYGSIAKHIQKPLASRAVGTAIGDNPVAFLIPCHRVIQASGLFGEYHWGATRKTVMIGWEAASADEALHKLEKTDHTTTTADGLIQ